MSGSDSVTRRCFFLTNVQLSSTSRWLTSTFRIRRLHNCLQPSPISASRDATVFSSTPAIRAVEQMELPSVSRAATRETVDSGSGTGWTVHGRPPRKPVEPGQTDVSSTVRHLVPAEAVVACPVRAQARRRRPPDAGTQTLIGRDTHVVPERYLLEDASARKNLTRNYGTTLLDPTS